MKISLKQYWPEIVLTLASAFFFLRELGTFPEAWLDDSLFMIVARNIAEGRGYALPVLDQLWWGSYFLAVGPTVILPSAFFIKIFGFSVAVARIPMVAFLLGTTWALYRFSEYIGGRANARWATALLVSFSAFVNTGKPVLGEIPGIFFLLLTLLVWPRARENVRWAIVAGVCLGLAFVTKTTMGILFPALGLVWIACLVRKRSEWRSITLMGITAVAAVLPFTPFLGMTDPGWMQEILQYGAADKGTGLLRVLREQPQMLLRFQYLYAFGAILPLGLLGWWRGRKSLSEGESLFLGILVLLFTLYFLSERGYYRHLLPTHILLLPFVPLGTQMLLSRRLSALILIVFIAAQGIWQLDHRGARRLNEAVPVAALIEEQHANERLVFQQPEVFVLLSSRPNWMFLSEEFQLRSYDRFSGLPLTQGEHCLPMVRKLSEPQQVEFGTRITKLDRRYVILAPPEDCGEPYERMEGNLDGSLL